MVNGNDYWIDWKAFKAEQEFMKEKEKEVIEWADKQPYLKNLNMFYETISKRFNKKTD